MPDNTSKTSLLISFLTLRQAVGFLGIFLPAALLIGTFLFGQCRTVLNTVSHYYFTVMGDAFVGIICAVALFLLAYKGYDRRDKLATNLAGIFALCVAFFPTSPLENGCGILTRPDNPLRVTTHDIAAALFFIILAYIALFLFTKSSGNKTPQKIRRNRVYRTSGIIILAAIVLVVLYYQVPFLQSRLASFKPVFWLEWIALIAFGVSWIVKGEFILKDQ